MNIRLLLRIFIGLSLTLPLSPLHAHHGMLEYDTGRLLELKGTVVGFELLDPHSLLYVDVEEDGKLVSWTIEGGKANGIVNAGLSKEYLSSGPTVVVLAYQSKDGRCRPRCRAVGRDFDFERIR